MSGGLPGSWPGTLLVGSPMRSGTEGLWAICHPPRPDIRLLRGRAEEEEAICALEASMCSDPWPAWREPRRCTVFSAGRPLSPFPVTCRPHPLLPSLSSLELLQNVALPPPCRSLFSARPSILVLRTVPVLTRHLTIGDPGLSVRTHVDVCVWGLQLDWRDGPCLLEAQ